MERTETETLVAAARHGDRDAWEMLYRRTYPRLVAFAYRRLGDRELAAEAVSDTMLRAVAAIGTYSGDDHGFDPWLFGICRHVVADLQRAMYRRLPASLLRPDVEGVGPAERLLADEERMLLRAAFDRLDPDEQELLELRVVVGLSAAEVGSVLGKQPGAIRMAQHRALSRLRTFLEEADRAAA
ncbi:MAG: RNA polymerase sigma factor [Acidimicrobiia bacterium]